MYTEISNVLKVTKVKHILKALISPSNSVKAFKYHYRRISQEKFVKYFADKWRCSAQDIDRAYAGLGRNSALWEEVKRKLSIYPNDYGLQMTKELSSLYLLVRLAQPKHLVETGVSAGVSSTYLLAALEDNNNGKLHSIDLPPENLPEGRTVGWIVPEKFRNRWDLYVGDSKDLLESVLDKIGKIDCFIHDSLHTYEHMIWEYRMAWDYIRPGGLFLSHDVGANEAFVDFLKENAISWSDYRIFHVLGAFQKQ
jgi:predicted O-methyltransferase YrrM